MTNPITVQMFDTQKTQIKPKHIAQPYIVRLTNNEIGFMLYLEIIYCKNKKQVYVNK